MASSPRIDELKKKFDENPRRYFAPLANEYRKAGDVAEAIRICRTHLPQQPGHMSGHIVFGQALYEAGELDEASQVFEAALALDPENLIALRHLGDIARVRGDAVTARHWYERVLEADPRNDEISAQIAALQAASPAPAAEAPPAPASEEGIFGWGDVNPEQPAQPSAPPSAPLDDISSHPTPVMGVETIEPLDLASPVDFDATVAIPAVRPPDEPPRSIAEPEPLGFEPTAMSPVDDVPRVEPVEGFADASREAVPEADAPEIDLGAFESRTQYPAEAPQAPSEPEPIGDEFGDLSGLQDAGMVPMSEETREGESVVGGAPEDFGFETSEFVAPAREPRAAGASDDVPEIDPNEATPAAFVTETMAELYLQQGFRDEALSVYRQLLAQNPHDESLRDRVRQLEQGARASISMAAFDEGHSATAEEAPAPERAPADDRAAGGPSVRDFFAALAARRAPTSSAGAFGVGASEVATHEASAYDTAVVDESSGASYDGYGAEEPGDAYAATAPDESPAVGGELPFIEVGDSPASGVQASELSELDAVEPSSLDYVADMTPDAPVDVLPTLGEVAGLDAASATDDAFAGMPRIDDDEPVAEPQDAAPAAGAVDTLFGGAAVSSADESAAAMLASVFARPEGGAGEDIPGRPTRAASSEISLDHVFRDGPGQAQPRRSSSGFSFDQFFSESAGGSAQPAQAPASDADAPDAENDIEQFNAWLEGLKKK